MRKMPIVLAATILVMLVSLMQPGTPRAQGSASAEVMKQLVPTGKLRAGINLGNSVLAQRTPTGELAGVSVDLARELGRRLGVPVELMPFKAAGESFAAMARNDVDVAFFAIEPKRAAEVAFTAPYVLIEGAYMVAKDSPLKTPADVDRPGIRVGSALARPMTSISRAP